MTIKLGIFGATGLVGQTMLSILEERNLPIENLFLFASERSAGEKIKFAGKDYEVLELNEENLKNSHLDYALGALDSPQAKKFLPIAAKLGIKVIDNSSAYRMDEDKPLVVPEINAEDAKYDGNIIPSPNCSTIQSVVALYPIYKKYGIKRIVYTTYQAVSGSGKKGMEDLERGMKGEKNEFYPYPIIGNVLPHIDDFLESGYSKEEMKMVNETKKIFHDDSLKITATTCRVPVRTSHMVAINVETKEDFKIEDVFDLYKNSKGIVLYDDLKNLKYPMPIIAAGKDPVYVGRIRKDISLEHGLDLICVADNMRKGAALNTIQILESLIK
ncbi:aspartate-semialdehyde dehydrogenase [uncultured Peptoniphilus sp.]|uniref:aspartate-semialdehyde dehydrogenase n=1 Tax=uncultured Peptoniphilus sp. TaxID=254354 RepID=UPI002804A389|nr:aspartate-semialdehyde dehydrogenase [uncultured Peptoniphilus sp.]